MRWHRLVLSCALLLGVGCGDDDGGGMDAATDADVVLDAGPPEPARTDHCDYAAVAPTANAGGSVEAGSLEAGAAELPLDMAVGSALGGYTSRADFMGSVPAVDRRFVEIAGAFKPSVGVETFPMARALALRAGGETVVIVKADLIFSGDVLTFELTERLGPELAGKVVFATSHTHSAWGHFAANSVLQIGAGRRRGHAHDRLLDGLEAVARAALDALEPAQLGVVHVGDFDLDDAATRDRRSENDDLPNGADRDDHDLFVIRVDAADGTPIAVVPVFGVHGTVLDADNPLATTDAPGAIERAVEETFDEPVVVMHLQGSGGDVSPAGSGGVSCPEEPCLRFARSESVGRYARDAIVAAWTAAGAAMTDTLALEAVTRSVTLGPDWRTFTVRDGALAYAAWDGVTEGDGVVFGPGDEVLSPIDDFNAPLGAGLCGEDMRAIFPMGALPGADLTEAYQSCVSVDIAAEALGAVMDLPFEAPPMCASTRTVISAVRIGDYLLVTAPGEPVTLWSDALRARSPVAPERTIVVGYAQGHVGYLLTAEDWLRGGYEPSINLWGPLEGEYVLERIAELLPLTQTAEREDAAAGGVDRLAATAPPADEIPAPDPAPLAGSIPTEIPAEVWSRAGAPLSSAQPEPIERLGATRFAWIGEDPLTATPRVTLEREGTPGAGDFAPVTRRSGRAVRDQDLLLLHTPVPLRRVGTDPRTHYWVVEWQAVTPWGTAGMADVDDAAGLPLGRYRFHVEGSGYTVDSEPFDVGAATLDVAVTRAGSTIEVSLGYLAPDGYRLLDQTVPSNERVPVRRGPASVGLILSSGASRSFSDVPVTVDGELTVDAGADAADVVTVRVVDRFGNLGAADL